MRGDIFQRLRRSVAVTALAAGALLAQTRVSSYAPVRSQTDPAAPRRIVLVALDGADWLAIDPLIRSGALPTFARLRARGRTGVMVVTPPLVSPLVWTTIATGLDPENHGILDFMQDLPAGRQAPVGSRQRLAPALWNLFSDADRRVAVVGWWATWPAERVRGTIVSDAVAPQLTREHRAHDEGLVSPPSAASRLSTAIVKISSLTRDDLSAYVPLAPGEFERATQAAALAGGRFYQDRLAHLAAIIASTQTYSAVAQTLLADERPDFLAVYLETIDTVSHLFIEDRQRGRRAIETAYKDADALLGRLAARSAPDTLIVVCSDHGFYPAGAGITEDPSNLTGPATAWHRPYGIVGAATAGTLSGRGEDPSFSGPADIGRITPLDIAPTLLHAAGLPVSAEMPGQLIRAMLPADAAARARRTALPAKFTPPDAPPTGRQDEAEALARLQALGYVGAVKTSLARLNLGESLLRRGKLAHAERELRTVVSVQPTNLSAWLWLAQALARQGRAAEALSAYREALALPGGTREGLIAATDLALDAGRLADARSLISAARSGRDGAPAVHVARGAVAESAGDARTAEREYRAALAADPLSFDAAARLLDLLLKAGRAPETLPALQRAVQLAPASPRHVALLGEARLAARDAMGAESAFRRALELAPDAESTTIVLGRALLFQQKFTDAIEALLPLTASADRDVLLGAAYSGLRDWVRASERLQAAIDAGRATPDVLNGLGWAQLQLGRKTEAAALLGRSLQANPDQPDIRRLLAQIQTKGPGGLP